MGNGEILKQLRAALENEPRINLHRHPIHLDFSGGDLILDGEVEDVAAKKLALELAGAMAEAGRIVDRLRVVPAGRMGDAEIRDHLRNALLEEPSFENFSIQLHLQDRVETVGGAAPQAAGRIEIEVQDGVVVLNGEVPSLSHKRLAGVLAWWVPGSRDVINGLEVLPPQEDNDGEVTDAVRLVLEKNPFVNADKIRVSTQNYVVTLEGFVPSEQMSKMAESDAWYVFGVDKVVNKLAVRR